MAKQKEPKTKKREEKVKKAGKRAYVAAIGRRKKATALVRLFKGKGEILVNEKPIEEYFPNETFKPYYLQPFKVTETLGKYKATIKVSGSGKKGQLEAIVLGLARALDKENKKLYHSSLKKYKLLTRDARKRERRKAGQMGKAKNP
jgi:small subunit ribosomal protein S9